MSDSRRIDTATLAGRIAAGTAPTILDVRSAAEFARGHIPGAIHIPFWRIGAHADRLPETTSEVVIYCGHGPRAAWARRALERRSYTRVIELVGHWAEWTRKARLESQKTRKRKRGGPEGPPRVCLRSTQRD